MSKKHPTKLINTAEFVKRLEAEGLKRTPAAITKAARTGRLRETVERGSRGELLFRWPAARDAFKANTDTTRARPEHLIGLERPAPTRQVAVWEGKFGRYEAPVEVAAALERADANPDEALLSPELVAHLDQIMFVTYGPGVGASTK